MRPDSTNTDDLKDEVEALEYRIADLESYATRNYGWREPQDNDRIQEQLDAQVEANAIKPYLNVLRKRLLANLEIEQKVIANTIQRLTQQITEFESKE